jgi:tripartite-type tricarboxylate transporter receptor subunit TctC
MNPNRRTFTRAAALLLCPSARAQVASWPAKPIRLVVGYPAGGLADALSRSYGEHLAMRLGQPVVVDNRAGAAGMLAGGEVARAAPDGYTLWMTLSSTVNQNRVLYKRMPYDPDKDFTHVAGFDPGPSVLAVAAHAPWRTLAELAAHAKKTPISFGNYAQGSLPHMMAQQLATKHGWQVDPVSYKGESPMWVDLASGQTTIALGSPLGLTPHLQSRKLRALAVTTATRSATMPEVPTFVEQGFTDTVFVVQGWLGLMAPAKTPPAVLSRVSDLVLEAAETPRIRQLHATFGLAPKPWPAAEFERLDRESKPGWIELARALNLTLD